MKKKLLSLVLVMMSSVSMIACGGGNVETVENNSVEAESEEVDVSEEIEEISTNFPQGTVTVEQFESYIEEEVVLTTENASEYFEVVVEQGTDDFGEPIDYFWYYVRLKEGYYAYTSEVVLRYEWIAGEFVPEEERPAEWEEGYDGTHVEQNDVTFSWNTRQNNITTLFGEPDDRVMEASCVKVIGTIYKINIPEEVWLKSEESNSLMIIEEDGTLVNGWIEYN